MPTRPIIVFVSYAHASPSWAIEEIEKMLQSFQKRRTADYQLQYFTDSLLKLGGDYNDQILGHLRSADVVLLLITRDFFYSDYIDQLERPIIVTKTKERIIPIIAGFNNYKNEWIHDLNLPTIPRGPESPIRSAQPYYRDEDLTIVQEKLHECLKETYLSVNRYTRSKTRISRSPSKLSTTHYIGFVLLAIVVAIMLFYWQYSGENVQERNIVPSGGYEPPSDAPVPRRLSDLPTSQQDISKVEEDPGITQQQGTELANPNFIPAKYDEITVSDLSPSRRRAIRGQPVMVGYTYYGKEPYGRYESCQGLDRNGFKPCKLDRRWYIVNESRDIHHVIPFPVETHKRIFAIRPFREGVAEVYFYNGETMYLEFCVGLNDSIVQCNIRLEP